MDDSEQRVDCSERRVNDSEQRVDDFERRMNDSEQRMNDSEQRIGDWLRWVKSILTHAPPLSHVTPCLGLWPSGALGGEKARLRVGFELRIVGV